MQSLSLDPEILPTTCLIICLAPWELPYPIAKQRKYYEKNVWLSLSVFAFVFTISSFGGLILDKTVSHPKFEGMAVFTPVINGKLNDASR